MFLIINYYIMEEEIQYTRVFVFCFVFPFSIWEI